MCAVNTAYCSRLTSISAVQLVAVCYFSEAFYSTFMQSVQLAAVGVQSEQLTAATVQPVQLVAAS